MTQPVVSYPSPPASREASPSPATEPDAAADHTPSSSAEGKAEGDNTLSARLDALLGSYLELLDTYTTLRAQLSKDFSSGFLALAQANRTSTLGPGRRYGEEGFDGRMKAFKTVRIGSNEELDVLAQEKGFLSGPPPKATIDERSEHEHEHRDNHDLKSMSMGDTETTPDPIEKTQTKQNREFSGLQPQTDPASSPTRLPSHHPTSAATCASASASGSTPIHNFSYTISSSNATTTNDTDTDPPSKSQFHSRDPLKWYGILTPPHLRQCQAHFTTSITVTIPDLLSTVSSLAALEESIWDLRRELGIMDEYSESTQHQSPIERIDAREEPVDLDLGISSHSAKPLGTTTSDRKKHEQKRTTAGSSAKAPLATRKKSTPLPSGVGGPGAQSSSGLSMHPRPPHPSEPRSRVLKLE